MTESYIKHALGEAILKMTDGIIEVEYSCGSSSIAAHKFQITTYDDYFIIRDADPSSKVFTRHLIYYDCVEDIKVEFSGITITVGEKKEEV